MKIEKLLIAFGLCVVLVFGTTVYWLVKNHKPFISGFVSGFLSALSHEPDDDSLGNWKTYPYPAQKCSIDSPIPLNPLDEGYSKESKAQIAHSMLVFGKDKKIFLFCSCLALKRGKMDLKGVEKATLRNIEIGKYHSNLKFSSKPMTWFGNPALYTEGTFNLFSVSHRKFKLLTVVKGPCNWQVQVQYADNDPKDEARADRIIKSFKIRK